MDHRYSQRKKLAFKLLVTDNINTQSCAETENISLDGLFIKSSAATRQKKNTSISLTIIFSNNAPQTHHTISAFVIRHSTNGYAVLFSEYDRPFISALKDVLATSSQTTDQHTPRPSLPPPLVRGKPQQYSDLNS